MISIKIILLNILFFFKKTDSYHINVRKNKFKNKISMEDFGLLKNTNLDYNKVWNSSPFISEIKLERSLNKQGLRYRMNKTENESKNLKFGFDIGILKSPKVENIWEALGFTATSNNIERQKVKLEAKFQASQDPNDKRKKYLFKYGYPRLVGTKGIFYADQLSSDKVPMGGFGMYKSGIIWRVPEVVEKGTYSGISGWGGKLNKKLKFDL